MNFKFDCDVTMYDDGSATFGLTLDHDALPEDGPSAFIGTLYFVPPGARAKKRKRKPISNYGFAGANMNAYLEFINGHINEIVGYEMQRLHPNLGPVGSTPIQYECSNGQRR